MVKAESCGFLNPCERIAFCCMQNAVAGIVCLFLMVGLLEKKIDELARGGTKLPDPAAALSLGNHCEHLVAVGEKRG